MFYANDNVQNTVGDDENENNGFNELQEDDLEDVSDDSNNNEINITKNNL